MYTEGNECKVKKNQFVHAVHRITVKCASEYDKKFSHDKNNVLSYIHSDQAAVTSTTAPPK